MSALEDHCRTVLNSVDDGLGFAVVDLESGLLLAATHNVPYFTQSYLDAVAAAAVDMFRGRTVSAVETLIAQQRGVPPRRLTREIQMTTEHTYHFMLVLPNKPNALVVLITGRRANLGLGWSAVRMAAPQIEPLVP
ncbi:MULTISPECIES: hypothetical protein [unclassified Salinibacterium]|jgi:hypothetical protein|uniref:hypothetical protein n=1 Tax=unclassified Salinibacterium TaxID=2632331 RepID=UPI00141EA737|nr:MULTISPECIES: hypothetical protein [unclassified Salinibacterium]